MSGSQQHHVPGPDGWGDPASLLEGLVEGLGYRAAALGILGESPEERRVVGTWSGAGEVPDGPMGEAMDGDLVQELLQQGELLVTCEARTRFPADPLLARAGGNSILGVSLRGADGEPLGVLVVFRDGTWADESALLVLRVYAERAAAWLDRRRVGGRLRNVEDNFRLVFEQSPNAIILFDPDSWRPVEFNDQAAEMMGYTREEFSALSITDLEMVPDPEETRAHVARIRRTGGDVFEAFHRAKDGSPRQVVVSLRMTTWNARPMMLTIWHDITARKEAEQALEESERLLQSIFDSAKDAVILLDQGLAVERMNPAAEVMFRCGRGELDGRKASDLFHGDLFARARRRAGAGQPLWIPEGLTARRSDGEIFPVELTLSPFEVEGRDRFTLILRDTNDRTQAEAELQRLREDNRRLHAELTPRTVIIGTSPAMAGLLSHVDKVASTDSTVLVLGETGTGKELIARRIHELSERQRAALVTVNCAALPRDLLESELFGHERGAFTGANQRKRGRFEVAHGGTIFLDEVGELTHEAQSRLLRVLQEGEVQRVGSETTIRVDVRVVAATHRDLIAMVREGSFRSDLYYRLSVFPLHVPPLRERRTDLPDLIDHFVGQCAGRFGKSLSGFDAGSLDQLCSYSWPGNVRELQNVIERSAILCSGPLLSLEGSLLNDPFAPAVASANLDEVTARHLRQVLAECRWVIEGKGGAAVRLGLKPATLRSRLKKLGIQRPA